jgi:hypothetical protein
MCVFTLELVCNHLPDLLPVELSALTFLTYMQ